MAKIYFQENVWELRNSGLFFFFFFKVHLDWSLSRVHRTD